ncbi:MAG: aminopeptidase P N-terminal domain-containing protein [Spirochaetota bacterium]
MLDDSVFQRRISSIQKKLGKGETLILFAANYKQRNRDVDYKFRQNSDFYYLTGTNEADAILLLQRNDSAIFVLPKNREEEIWTGYRIGPKLAKKKLALRAAYSLEEWDMQKEHYLTGQQTLYYFFGEDIQRDTKILTTCKDLSRQVRNGKTAPLRLEIPHFLHELRLRKSSVEIEELRESAKITALGHMALLQETKPGMYEYELEAILDREYLKAGAWGGGYGHIVAAGSNATVLHYTENQKKIRKGELLLVDSGAEKDYYTADVTRVFPSAEKFTNAQKDIYQIVLQAQKQAIKTVRVGNTFQSVHDAAVSVIVDGLRDLKLLKGSREKNIAKQEYRRYYMHKTGHWLGMDVHDVGLYYKDGKSRKLEQGMLTTVEPGLYFAADDKKVAKELRGIGIRIEDDILVGKKKPINLTVMIPKEVKEIEAIREKALEK